MLRFSDARYHLLNIQAGSLRRLFQFRKLQRLSKLFLVTVLLWLIWYYYVFYASNQSALGWIHVEKHDTVRNATTPFTSTITMGALNIHIWRRLCGSNMRNIRQSLFFPQYPDEMLMKCNIIEFQIEDKNIDYGQRIFGFLHPPERDVYQFAIASDDESELWLSISDDPSEKKLIARVFKEGVNAWTKKNELNKYPEQISKDVKLHQGAKYFIEVVHKQGVGDGFVQVYWKHFKEKDFKIISSEYLSSHSGNAMVTNTKDVLHNVLSGRYHQDLELKSKLKGREYLKFYSLPLVSKDSYLPSCDFKTHSVLKTTVRRYQGRRMVRVSRVYPADDSSMKTERKIRNSWPNQVADRNTTLAILDKIITALSLKTLT